MIGYCGIDCTKCSSFKDNTCQGCKTEINIETSKCQILICAIEKSIEYCSDCLEFPCEKNKGI